MLAGGELSGRILTADGWVTGHVAFDARITRIVADEAAAGGPAIVPGFIDLHVHGGGGADSMDGADAVRQMARVHARHGTTALLPTTMTAPRGELETALTGIAAVAQERQAGEARVLGAHLEGPFINPDMLGAQPPFARPATSSEIDALCALAPLRVVTLAPEIAGGAEAITRFASHGVRVQLGHSNCSFEQAEQALGAGAAGITHLFNAMSGLHHRAPGLAGAALVLARHGELIADGIHVHDGAMRLALRAMPGLHVITDATAAAGMPDGTYRLGRHDVIKTGDAVRLADGTLAGSALTMDRALTNLLALGLQLDDAARRLATLPADYLGLADRGRIAPGAFADLVVLDPSHAVCAVYVEGEAIDLADAAGGV